jgi:hypothetical protein
MKLRKEQMLHVKRGTLWGNFGGDAKARDY